FSFQAEDGIRDFHVTGVQTCALPIYRLGLRLVQLRLLPDRAELFLEIEGDLVQAVVALDVRRLEHEAVVAHDGPPRIRSRCMSQPPRPARLPRAASPARDSVVAPPPSRGLGAQERGGALPGPFPGPPLQPMSL